MGVPKIDGLFHGKFHLEMDDDWGVPCFRKPHGRQAVSFWMVSFAHELAHFESPLHDRRDVACCGKGGDDEFLS